MKNKNRIIRLLGLLTIALQLASCAAVNNPDVGAEIRWTDAQGKSHGYSYHPNGGDFPIPSVGDFMFEPEGLAYFLKVTRKYYQYHKIPNGAYTAYVVIECVVAAP